ncbi:hypothetical protein JWG39_02575 [Desulforhopalus vacuolatus]|uniref:hypothetical protein n=1 Tax=Desulforhopalus vacuolatus TaxID=40414 RepID=UPI001965A424|nr:hypothetical protein [Desulforhopalus vacuolatus]MBM9518702.1 hypothetical protein [Desulforhopalus vacuolatus]
MLKKFILTAALLPLLFSFTAQAEETTAPGEQAATATPTASAAILRLLQQQGLADQSTVDAISPHLDLFEKQLAREGKTSAGKLDDLLHSEKVKALKGLFSGTGDDGMGTGSAPGDHLADMLTLSKKQMTKVKPALSEGFTDLRKAAGGAIASGKVRWEEFRPEYDAVVSKMRNKVKESLNSEQMKTFDTFIKDKREAIQKALQ